MTNLISRRIVQGIALALGATMAASMSHAETMTRQASPWRSNAHFGYAVEKQSSTGFELVGGSTVFLDLAREFPSERIEAGIRTIASGGHGSAGTFYRLSSGPLITYHASDVWLLSAFAGIFSETGEYSNGRPAYQARGYSVYFGWERKTPINEMVEFAWGGFWGVHQGNMNALASTATGTSASDSASRRHHGQTQGLEISLRMKL